MKSADIIEAVTEGENWIPVATFRFVLRARYGGKQDGGVHLEALGSARSVWVPHRLVKSVKPPEEGLSEVVLEARVAEADQKGGGWAVGLLSFSIDVSVVWIPDEMIQSIEKVDKND